MSIRSAYILFLFLLSLQGLSQSSSPSICGQKEFTLRAWSKDPSLRIAQQQGEKQLQQFTGRKKSASTVTGVQPAPGGAVVLGDPVTPMVLPVVVHIVHENGPENISDLLVQTAIQHLNEAFANTGYYDPSDGAVIPIQFCLAQRDPDNQPTNGITRDVSPYTSLNPADPFSDDGHLKDVRRWNPLCYINIWIAKDLGGPGGYANYPYGHGNPADGIVIKASNVGRSYAGDVVIIHEMGHYLGLYHIFEGGCTNTDCSLDGDRVCDTPPSEDIPAVHCGQAVNSCSTDVLSGFSSDQNDLTTDYMDYGDFACMKVFTQGQCDRMVASVQTLRSSLLHCKSCMPPCPSPAIAGFAVPAGVLEAGDTYTFVNTSSGGDAYEWYVNGKLASTATDYTFHFDTVGSYEVRLVVRTHNDLCLDAERSVFFYANCPGGCPTPPPSSADSCAVNTFQKVVGGTKNDFTLDVDVDLQGNACFFGHTANGSAGGEDMLIIKTDRGGKILRARAYGDASGNYGYSGRITADGGAIQLGSALGGQFRVTLYKTDNAGNVQWSRNYSHTGISIQIYRVIQTSDGGYLISAAAIPTISFNAPFILIKTDGNGNVLWSKEYFLNALTLGGYMIEDGNRYVAVGEVAVGVNPNSLFALSVDKSTGNPAWSRTYRFDNSLNMRTEKILKDGNRYLLSLSYTTDGTGTIIYHEGFVYLDGQGGFSAAYMLDTPVPLTEPNSLVPYSDVALTSDGNICFYYGENRVPDSMDAHLAKMTPDGQLLAAKRYVLPGQQFLEHIHTTREGGIIGAGYAVANASIHTYFLKTDSLLRLTDPSHEAAGCTVTDETPAIHQPAVAETMVPAGSADLTMAVTDSHPIITDLALTAIDYCSNPALCSSLKISGQDSACVSGRDTLTFSSGKDPGCTLPVNWQADPARVRIISTTDSSIRLVLLQAGPVELYATLALHCKVLRDSLLLHAFQSPDAVDLGEDLDLCKQSTVRLHAGSGFMSYHWQDGAADSIYTAYLPGKYYVQARDYCDHVYSDTILISLAPDPLFDLGPDTVLCRNDTLLIQAPAGFSDYSWSPQYRTLDPYSQAVRVYPQRDTTYACTAVKGRGCTVIDTIRVKVYQLPEHFIAPLTGICDGPDVSLTYLGDWVKHKWFNGSGRRSVSVNFAGTYSMEVTDTNGCVGRDSVTVDPAICHPGIYFPNAFTPDQNGRNDIFRPVVSASLDKFYLAIYNRQGERIFETTDPQKGWDGRLKGILQTTNTFLWYAIYHLQGSPDKESKAKGTVTLVR